MVRDCGETNTEPRRGTRAGLPFTSPAGQDRRTRVEAVAVAALCRARGWDRVLLVTSPLHSRRGAASLEQVGVSVLSSPALETQFDLETLDRPSERLRAFASALHERLGLWYYERQSWVGPGAGAGS